MTPRSKMKASISFPQHAQIVKCSLHRCYSSFTMIMQLIVRNIIRIMRIDNLTIPPRSIGAPARTFERKYPNTSTVLSLRILPSSSTQPAFCTYSHSEGGDKWLCERTAYYHDAVGSGGGSAGGCQSSPASDPAD